MEIKTLSVPARAVAAACLLAAAPAAGQEPEAASMFRFELAIGEAGPLDLRFARIADLAVATDGTIWVVDAGARVVRVFDGTGAFVGTPGGPGSGPVELDAPAMIRIVRDTVIVYDAGQQRVSRFSLKGEALGWEPLLPPPNLALADPTRLRDGRMLARSIYRASLSAKERDPDIHVVLFQSDAARLDTLTSMPASPVVWYVPERPSQWGGETSPFGQGGAWALSGDSMMAIVNGYAGEVSFVRVEPGGMRRFRTVTMSARGRPVTDHDLTQLRREIDRYRSTPLPRDVAFLTPPQWSIITGNAFFARDGTLWMERNNLSETRAVWTRIDPRTGTLRNFAFPKRFSLRSVDGLLHHGVWTEDDGRQSVRVYRSVNTHAVTG